MDTVVTTRYILFNVELGDIVGGRERITGIVMAKPISKKIVKITNNKLKISYEVK